MNPEEPPAPPKKKQQHKKDKKHHKKEAPKELASVMEPRPNVGCDTAKAWKSFKMLGNSSEEKKVHLCKDACLKEPECRLSTVTLEQEIETVAATVPTCSLFKSKKDCHNGADHVLTFAKKRPSAAVETCDPMTLQYGI